MKLFATRMPMAVLCTAGALVAAACASTAPQNALSGTHWQVETLGGQMVGERAPTIELAADRIVGTGGCNRYFGAYSVEGEAISVGAVGSTEMACEPPIMAREASFFAALSASRTYRRLGDTLILTADDGGTIVLRPA